MGIELAKSSNAYSKYAVPMVMWVSRSLIWSIVKLLAHSQLLSRHNHDRTMCIGNKISHTMSII